MNTTKTERKGKAAHTEKIKTYVPLRWCVHSTFAHGDISDPLKMYRGKDCGKDCRIRKRRGKEVV